MDLCPGVPDVSVAAERLVLQGAEDADILLVEGQGSLIHPGYSGVTLGLLHGTCPDALILCHQVTRDHIGDYHGREPWVRIPPLSEMIEIYESAAAPVRPTRVIGIALNTFDLDDERARAAVRRAMQETGLPATDPVRFGPAPLRSGPGSAVARDPIATILPSSSGSNAAGAFDRASPLRHPKFPRLRQSLRPCSAGNAGQAARSPGSKERRAAR